MALFFDLLDQSKQCNRASQNSLDQLPFHAPNNKYKMMCAEKTGGFNLVNYRN